MVGATVATVILVSCSTTSVAPPVESNPGTPRVSFPSGQLKSIASVDGQITDIAATKGAVVGLVFPDPTSDLQRLVILDNEVRAIELPTRPDCMVTVYRGLAAMGQRLFAVEECVLDAFDGGRGIEDRVVELNLATGEADPVTRAIGFRLTSISPYQRGVFLAGEGNGICSGLIMVSSDPPQRPEFVTDFPSEGGQRPIPSGSRDCTGQPRADYPTVHVSSVAYLASPSDPSAHGQERLEQPWAIHLAEQGSSQAVLDGLHEPRFLEWNPTGRYLGFSGAIGDRHGAWVIEADGQTLWFAADGEVAGLAWSADGASLYVAKVDGDVSTVSVLTTSQLQ